MIDRVHTVIARSWYCTSQSRWCSAYRPSDMTAIHYMKPRKTCCDSV